MLSNRQKLNAIAVSCGQRQIFTAAKFCDGKVDRGCSDCECRELQVQIFFIEENRRVAFPGDHVGRAPRVRPVPFRGRVFPKNWYASPPNMRVHSLLTDGITEQRRAFLMVRCGRSGAKQFRRN